VRSESPHDTPNDATAEERQFFTTDDDAAPGTTDQIDDVKAVADLIEEVRNSKNANLVFESVPLLARLDEREYQSARKELKAILSRALNLVQLDAAVKAARLKANQESPNRNKVRIAGDYLTDCPVPNCIIPFDYEIEEDIVKRRVRDRNEFERLERVADAAILIVRIEEEITMRKQRLELTWRHPFGWKKHTIERSILLNSRSIIGGLGDYGFPVSSENAGKVVSYLASLESANLHRLPCLRVTESMGWQGASGSLGFMWGTHHLPRDPDESDSLAFRGAAAGNDQKASAFHELGKHKAWLDAVRVVRPYPKVKLGLYAAFVPPLLEILGVPNFVMDWWNRTSTGKTTLLRVVASVWGKPDERAEDGCIATWDSTSVGLARRCALLNSLPVILDDTARVKERDKSGIAHGLYAITSGHDRERGNPQGLDASRTWRTVGFSTGEAPATSFTKDGGTRTRCMEIAGLPFGAQDENTRQIVAALNNGVMANYGLAGPAFVRWLLDNREMWPEWRAAYQENITFYANRALTPEGGRLAGYAAAIGMAAQLVHMVPDLLDWEYEEPFGDLWETIAGEAEDAAGAEAALRHVVSWAYSHEGTFKGREEQIPCGETTRQAIPHGNAWSGRWDQIDWEFLAFYQHILEDILKKAGHEPQAILTEWRERGWLDITADGKRRFTKRIRVEGESPHLISIKRNAVDEVEGEDPDDENEP